MSEEQKKEIMDAAYGAYEVALSRCYTGGELAAYMFVQGMKYQKTGKADKDPIKELLKECEQNGGK